MPLPPWRKSHMLTPTRTIGAVQFRKNGTELDIWLRVNGKPTWFSVGADKLRVFLASPDKEVFLAAESDGNAEET